MATINEKVTIAISHLLLCLMMGCVAASLAHFFSFFARDITYLGWLGLLISIEAVSSFRVARRLPTIGNDVLTYRAAEVVTILVALRLFVELRHGLLAGFERLAQIFASWPNQFFENFLSGEFFLALFVLTVIWVISSIFANDLAELEGDEFILNKASQEAVPSNRRGIHRQLVERVLFLGVGLALLEGITRQTYIPIPGQALNDQRSILTVVAYFVLSLAFLGQSNFAAWRASWGYERAVIERDLAVRWSIYSLLFLLGLCLVALFLPTRYALGLFPTINYLIQLIIAVIGLLVSLILLPIAFLMSLLSRLFGGAPGPEAESAPPPTPPVLEQITEAPIPWVELLKSILFWGVLIGIVVYALVQYIRQNQQLLRLLRRIFLWHWLSQAWGWMRSGLGSLGASAAAAVQAGLARLRALGRAQSTQAWGYLNLRRLSPRQRVFFYYLALVRRAGEAGAPRAPAQTPSEYAHTLNSQFPEAQEDVTTLTESFSVARYSRLEIAPQQASLVQLVWEHLRRLLRRSPS